MGLDVAFSRKAALEAGMEVKLERRSTLEEVAEAKASGTYSTDYLAWLGEQVELIRLPTGGHWLECGLDPETYVVRANRWGVTYAPLTRWLEANNIEWSEF